MSDLDSELEAPDDMSHDIREGLSPTEYREKQEELRERQELNHALRNFAEHFGAEEVFEQAKAIYLESTGGQTETNQESAEAWASVVQDAAASPSVAQSRVTPAKQPRKGSPGLEAAKRLLGG